MKTILDTAGSTPVIAVRNMSRKYDAEICVKLERLNPAGSIKDRPAKYIIEQAEKEGTLKPGGTIIESSSGNFGISCAMIAAAKGYKALILVDPKVTPTNRAMLKAFGAKIIVVDEKDDSGSYHKTRISLANKLHKEIDNSFRPDQCFNLQNGESHFLHTAPELYDQCEGRIDVLILTVSTGGQIGGFSRFFNEVSRSTKIIAVDAVGSTVFGGDAHAYLLPGMGLSWTPANIRNLEHLHSIYKVPDELAFLTCRALGQEEGVLVGGSTGAAMAVATRMAYHLGSGKRVVCIAADSGERYLDTIYSDEWMQGHGLNIHYDLKELRKQSIALQPYSENPLATANYQPELADVLGAPLTDLGLASN